MARRKSSNLTEGELRLMQVLWKGGPATVGDVVKRLPADPPVAYTTVLTMLRILESKGHVRHTKQGRAFVYEPLMGSKEAGRNAVRHLLSRFFGGSREQLIMNLLEEEIDPRELKRIKKRINESD